MQRQQEVERQNTQCNDAERDNDELVLAGIE